MGTQYFEGTYSAQEDIRPYLESIKNDYRLAPFEFRKGGHEIRADALQERLANELVKVTFTLGYNAERGIQTEIVSIQSI